MKLRFLIHPRPTPSAEWRVMQYVPHYRELGAEVEVVELSDDRDQLRGAADVVVLQKKLLSWWNARTLRRHATALVYEFDDAVMFGREGAETRVSGTRDRRFRRLVKGADAVTTSNAHLEALAAELRPRSTIRVFPNTIDTAEWPARPERASARIRVGWYGSPANLEHLQLLREPLAALGGVEFCVVSERKPDVACTFVPYDRAREREQIASFDIAVAPMSDTEWTRGKQPVKVLCYMATGLPIVASDLPAHREMLGDAGLIARTPAEWVDALRRLAADADLRAKLGRAARRRVEERFATRPMARVYLDFYASVWNRVRGPSV